MRIDFDKVLLMDLYRLLGNILFTINCLADTDLGREPTRAMVAMLGHVQGRPEVLGFKAMGLPASATARLALWQADVKTDGNRRQRSPPAP